MVGDVLGEKNFLVLEPNLNELISFIYINFSE